MENRFYSRKYNLSLQYVVMFYFFNPFFLIYNFHGKELKYLIYNFIFVLMIYGLIIFILIIIQMITFHRMKELKINLNEIYLEILFKDKSVKKIYYDNIEMILVRKNLFGSHNLMINFPTNNSIHTTLKSLIEDKNSLSLANISNIDEIKEKLLKRFEKDSSKKTKLEYTVTFYTIFINMIFFIIGMYYGYKIKVVLILLLIPFVRYKSKKYSFIETNYGIKVFKKGEVLFLKEGNYKLNDKNLYIKIKNSDTLLEKFALGPYKFKILR